MFTFAKRKNLSLLFFPVNGVPFGLVLKGGGVKQ